MVRQHIARLVWVPAASARLLSISAAAHAVPYAITGLGTLGGNFWTEGDGVNAAGQVTGYSYLTGNTAQHAFLYTPGTGMQDLGTLGGTQSMGNSVNAVGQVTGAANTAGNAANHAFLYTPGIGMQDLGTLGGSTGLRRSAGYGINDIGQVTGVTTTPGNDGGHAFVYTPGIGMMDIGTLAAGGGSVGQAINAVGQVTGRASTADDTAIHAFLYTPSVGMQDLGTLGGINSFGFGLNAAGQVTGYAFTAGNAAVHAFLYSDGKMIDLNDLLPPLSGWTVTVANGINDAGQITGSGMYNGETHAFLMTVDLSRLLGDANCDGRVDADDYALVDRGFASGMRGWGNGDFNGDGVVDQRDYLIIDTAFAQRVGLAPDLMASREAQFGTSYVAELAALVPEPSSIGAIVSGVAMLFRRRR